MHDETIGTLGIFSVYVLHFSVYKTLGVRTLDFKKVIYVTISYSNRHVSMLCFGFQMEWQS